MKTILLFFTALILYDTEGYSQTWEWTHPEPNGVIDSFNTLSDADYAHDVETDAAGNVYVLGNFGDSLYLNNNLVYAGHGGSYLAKYDSTGKLRWSKLIIQTAPSDEVYFQDIVATDLVVNSTGVYITGKYTPTSYLLDCSTHILTIGTSRSYSIGSTIINSAAGDVGFFITKFNANGGVVWNKTAIHPIYCKDSTGTQNYAAISLSNPLITSDKDNNIISSFVLNSEDSYFKIAGDSIPLKGSKAPNPDYLIVTKYNAAGSLQWSTYAGGGFNTGDGPGNGFVQDANSMVTDKNSNVFFLGIAYDSTYFGSLLYRQTATINNGYYNSTFLSKISSTGVWQFARELSNTYDTYMKDGISHGSNPEKLAIDNNNNLYALVDASTETQVILGDTVSHGIINTSCYLVKMNTSGNLTWVKSFGSTEAHTYTNSIHYNNNNLYMCGANSPFYTANQKLVFSGLYVPPVIGYSNSEFYAAKADLNGNFIWVTTFQDGGYNAYGTAIKALNGNIYIGGEYDYKITSLGNLNGSFTNSNSEEPNLFLGKLKDEYIKVGVVSPTSLIPGCTITIPFTSTGLTFSAGNTFTAELSDVSGDFTTATAIGSTVSTGTGSITATIPASLTYSSGYRVRIHSSDTLKTGYGYYAYADTPYVISLICPIPSDGFTVTNITGAAATLNWTAVPCASGYKVQYRVKGTTSWTTVNINTNTATLNITGLTANTNYQWRVATKCKNNGTNSFSDYSATKQFKTAAALQKNITTTTLAKQNADVITVSPNPAKNTININIAYIKNKINSVQILNATGAVVMEQQLQNSGRAGLSVDVSKFASGTYIILLKTKDNTLTARFIKE